MRHLLSSIFKRFDRLPVMRTLRRSHALHECIYIVERVKSTYFQFQSHAFGRSCSPNVATDEWTELFRRVTFRTIVLP